MSKKLKVIAALCAVTAVSLFSGVVGCGGNEETKHTYSADWSKDATNHWHACIDEGCTEIDGKAAHAFDEGKVTKEATCAEAGEKVYTCSVCKYEKEETIAKTDEHKFDDGVVTTAPTFEKEGVKTFTCSVCGYEKTESVPKKEHSYSADWSKDATSHWHACTDDGYETLKKDLATHIESAIKYSEDKTKEYTECTVCGYKMSEKEHTHTAIEGYESDETSHWQLCACGEKMNITAHAAKDDNYKIDETNHWKECVCGAKVEVAAHTAGSELKHSADKDYHWNECTVCGTEMNKTTHTAKDDKYESDDENHWQLCTCGEKVGVAAHEFGAWVTVTEPTLDADGTKKHTCSVCEKEVTTAMKFEELLVDYVTVQNFHLGAAESVTSLDGAEYSSSYSTTSVVYKAKITNTNDVGIRIRETANWANGYCFVFSKGSRVVECTGSGFDKVYATWDGNLTGNTVEVGAVDLKGGSGETYVFVKVDGTTLLSAVVSSSAVSTGNKVTLWAATFEQVDDTASLLEDYVTVTNSTLGLAESVDGFEGATYTSSYSTTSVIYKAKITGNGNVKIRAAAAWEGGYQFNIIDGGKVQVLEGASHFATTDAIFTTGDTVEYGAIDLKDGKQTYIFIKINGVVKYSTIRNSLEATSIGNMVTAWGGTFEEPAAE